jgi:hypothetical protein
MDLAQVTETKYLAANDYAVGTVFPLLPIERITIEEVPVPGKKDKKPKAVIYFAKANKGWAANKQCLREIAKKTGATKGIDTAWIGCSVSLVVVGEVRRPDGTFGNAFRINDIKPKQAEPANEQKA